MSGEPDELYTLQTLDKNQMIIININIMHQCALINSDEMAAYLQPPASQAITWPIEFNGILP
jgi:hypothetical protein